MRLGIYGGSFDPIHLGHTRAAAEVRQRLGLDSVQLVVAAQPPHKQGGCVASFEHRVAMARLAAAQDPGLGVLDLEGRRQGPSFTFYTVTALAQMHPGAHIALLVGADMLEDLPGWHRAKELVAAVQVAAFGRPGFDFCAAESAFRAAFGAPLTTLEIEPTDASSTKARRRLAAGKSTASLLAPEVAAYIAQNRLYAAENRG